MYKNTILEHKCCQRMVLDICVMFVSLAFEYCFYVLSNCWHQCKVSFPKLLLCLQGNANSLRETRWHYGGIGTGFPIAEEVPPSARACG